MTTRLGFVPVGLILVALCGSSSAAQPQDNSQATNSKPATSTADQYPDLWEIDPFGGVSLFAEVQRGLREKLIDGGVAGGRLTWNFSHHLGAELSYSWMENNVRLITPISPGLPSYDFGNRIHYPALNIVYDIKPRGSRVVPFITLGGGGALFTPTNAAISHAKLVDPIYHSGNLSENLQVGVNYGGGVKFHISNHVGLRVDGRGFWSRNPTFGLPNFNNGGIYIPSGHSLNGFQGTIGLVIFAGQPKLPPPPTPPPPPAPLSAGDITGNAGTLCQGKAITLHSTASDPQGHALGYAWKLNGTPSGSNSPDFSFTPNNAGDFKVEVTITDTTQPSRSITAGPLTLTVQEYAKPVITSVAATPTTLSCAADTTGTHSANLAGQATGSTCGGNLSYKWTVSEGSVTNDTSANATFDAGSLSFDPAGGQSKTITATLTVTDETSQSATQTTTITVNCPPQFKRLPDIVFAKNNARVNNCGKRILIDQAAPQAGTNYDIVLVGHRASDEAENAPAARRGRGKKAEAARALDEQRALNAAAVLIGDHGTCANVDPAGVKVDWVGTDQTSTPDPGLCGTSNLPATKERRGSQVTDADKERRVEVYLVPKGTQTMPPAVKNVKQLPESDVKALGCPK